MFKEVVPTKNKEHLTTWRIGVQAERTMSVTYHRIAKDSNTTALGMDILLLWLDKSQTFSKQINSNHHNQQK